jgi:acetyltransferase-like isoleucine patch superfamily enzyme
MSEYFIHENAIVEPGCQIGARTRIWAFVHILPGAIIGEDCNICDHCFVENDVVIGDNVTIKSGIYVWDGLRISNQVFLGPNVAFTNDKTPRSKCHSKNLPQTFILEGASIGANATILPGVTIGQWAMIGAGSIVTKDVPAFALVLGSPARQAGYVCICAQRLQISQEPGYIRCECGKAYKWDGTNLTNNSTLHINRR